MCYLASANVVVKAFEFAVDLLMYLCLGEIENKVFVYVQHQQETLWYVHVMPKTVGAYSRGCTVAKPESSSCLDTQYGPLKSAKMTSCPM